MEIYSGATNFNSQSNLVEDVKSLLNSVIVTSILSVSALIVFNNIDSVDEIFALIPSSDRDNQAISPLNPPIKPKQTTPSTPSIIPRTIDPNKALDYLANNPNIKVLPPGVLPYTCTKSEGESQGVCKSVGVKDSVQMVQDNVCDGQIHCADEGCVCIWKH